ncbi:phosphatidate cytidylyltransferase [Parahaliea aestuarii]|uniref:Phosphatidate cytidylyltransferase n=1 Tax=Parahaliea aestuarii TaxID=1852021 RepID=A0A5C8ZMB1_9GAMM|nr:phosphatidate cytidylyltransferase [Parahaliea aestuarii]TXS89696.1 phosphatidate cytidylyltransferase [Parahaliea aestuarii]
MLRQRVFTALVMAALFLAAMAFLPLPGLALFFALVVSLGAWEWAPLAGWRPAPARGLYVLLNLGVLAGLYVYCGLGQQPEPGDVQPILGLGCLWWSFLLLWVKGYPASAVLWGSVPARSIMGLLVMSFAWVAAVYLLTFPRGGILMVCMVLVVAAADIGAYFAGKTFGRHKLAAAVSPAKTWEGFWGGMASALLLAVVFWYLLPPQMAHVTLMAVIFVTLCTALASVVGDLAVSMVKRECGVKDSGSILPGHGGVLDRLDSICGAAPVFALGLLLAGW